MSRSTAARKQTGRGRSNSAPTANPKGSTVTWLAIGGAVIGAGVMTVVMLNRKHAAMEVCGTLAGALGQIGTGA